ncbi:MAG TPA: hypothetical protein VKI65_13435, partial [Gemmataceae bacterium]|nr:hypothetical protein [Gemmataceae bacterium]
MLVSTVECSPTGGENPEGAMKAMRDMFGPQHVDQMIQQAVSSCWMMLPDDRRTMAVLEAEIRRLVDRAIKDFKEDSKAFGRP